MKKVNYQNLSSKLSLLLLVFVLAFSTNTLAQEEGDANSWGSAFINQIVLLVIN